METITQRHNRILATQPMTEYLQLCADDIASGDMTISRLRATMGNCHFVSRLKRYTNRFGKMAKIRDAFNMPNAPHRLPQYSMNEFRAYLLEAAAFIEELGLDGMTAQQICALGELHKPSEYFPNGR
jgi:hypothetical protein